jgi:uncharacterized protein RhaS with RHS repeats
MRAGGRVERLRLLRAGNAIYDVALSRNEWGAIDGAVDTDGHGLDHSASFVYDPAARLIESELGAGATSHTFTFTYDAIDNMTSRLATGPAPAGALLGVYHHGGGAGPRQLTSVDLAGGGGTRTMTYDAAGRQITDGDITMTYDAFDPRRSGSSHELRIGADSARRCDRRDRDGDRLRDRPDRFPPGHSPRDGHRRCGAGAMS